MNLLECNPYHRCDLGDKRLTRRAASIAECLSVKYGQPLSTVFKSASDLKPGFGGRVRKSWVTNEADLISKVLGQVPKDESEEALPLRKIGVLVITEPALESLV